MPAAVAESCEPAPTRIEFLNGVGSDVLLSFKSIVADSLIGLLEPASNAVGAAEPEPEPEPVMSAGVSILGSGTEPPPPLPLANSALYEPPPPVDELDAERM